MKVSKIFGCVLSLHLCVIAVLLVQPGCQTGQPPTQTHTQTYTQTPTQTPTPDRAFRSNVEGASRSSGELIPATQLGEGQGLDAAFNAGFESDSLDSFENVEPLEPIEPLQPIESMSGLQTVDIAGSGFQSYTVKKGDNLWSIAKRYDVSLNELYAVNGLNKNSVIRVGQQIQLPVESSTATVSVGTPDTYQPSGFDQATTTYTVQRGDNLSRIAKRYDTTVRALKAANGKSSDIIRVGESLVVPAGSAATGGAPMSSTPTPAITRSVAASGGGTRTHTVKAGEFPGKIARQYGMTTNELLAMNSITDPRKLRVGRKLTVSGSGSAANVDSRVETVVRSAPAQPVSVVPSLPSTRIGSNEIRIIEADPLLEGEFSEPVAAPDPDDIFNNAIEIPVIRLEE